MAVYIGLIASRPPLATCHVPQVLLSNEQRLHSSPDSSLARLRSMLSEAGRCEGVIGRLHNLIGARGYLCRHRCGFRRHRRCSRVFLLFLDRQVTLRRSTLALYACPLNHHISNFTQTVTDEELGSSHLLNRTQDGFISNISRRESGEDATQGHGAPPHPTSTKPGPECYEGVRRSCRQQAGLDFLGWR